MAELSMLPCSHLPLIESNCADADIVCASEPTNTKPHSLQKARHLLFLAVAYPGDFMRLLAVVAALQA
jgi:hypothetical protein